MRCQSIAVRALYAAAALALSACSGAGGTTPPTANDTGAQAFIKGIHRDSGSGKIQHVVIIVQENRSFNNLFMGVHGAKTQSYGYDTKGNKITLQPVGLETNWDIEHDSWGFLTSCNGTGSFPGTNCQMNGFDNQYWGCGHYGSKCPNSNPPYSYVPRTETKPYFEMAKYYALA